MILHRRLSLELYQLFRILAQRLPDWFFGRLFSYFNSNIKQNMKKNNVQSQKITSIFFFISVYWTLVRTDTLLWPVSCIGFVKDRGFALNELHPLDFIFS